MSKEFKYELYPVALYTVPRVKDLGLKTAVATTTPKFMFYKYLRPIKRYLDLIITGFEAGCDKSNPRMYTKVIERLEVQSNEVIVAAPDPLLDVEGPLRDGHARGTT